ncbi:MAG: 1-acyl-sn-glycerol-3-phosphate acyltransferase [Clostridiaceae bacterium]|nr:1-acyl-sn-glycerol-3-phosphate acyltransferase [Clostridiaceae bacterium]
MSESNTSPSHSLELWTTKPIERGLVGRFFNWAGSTVVRLGLRFEIRGEENLPADAPYILAPNHETYVDGMLIGMGLKKAHFDRLTSLAARELEESHGLFGKIIMRVGRGIPIDRAGSSIQSLKICIHQLEEGNILLIHPEGTRSPDGKLGKIRDGCSFIARHADCPVVPCFLDGGYEIFSRHMKVPQLRRSFWHRRRLILTYGKPLYPRDYKNTKELTEALSAWLHDMYANKEVPREYTGKNLAYMEKRRQRQEKRAGKALPEDESED